MFETSIVERASQLVEGISDFSVLKRIVSADRQGALHAQKVNVDVSLEKESYTDVLSLLRGIDLSSTVYDFQGVNRHFVKTEQDLDELRAAFLSDPDGAPRLHVFLEIVIPAAEFEALRVLLAKGNSLLLQSRASHGKISPLH